MANITSIIEGNILVSTATFTVVGTPVDPTEITFVWSMSRQPGTGGTLSYSGESTPQPGFIARTGEGVYVAEVDTSDQQGTLIWQWVSTGTGQASDFGQLAVTPLPLAV